MPNINEAKIAKAALQERIRLALREFSEGTGLLVDKVEMTWFFTMGETPDYVVDVEARL